MTNILKTKRKKSRTKYFTNSNLILYVSNHFTKVPKNKNPAVLITTTMEALAIRSVREGRRESTNPIRKVY